MPTATAIAAAKVFRAFAVCRGKSRRQKWQNLALKSAYFRHISSWICVLVENLINRYILFFGKAPEKGLFLCFGFAAFAVFAVANVCQFADCRGKGNWRQNGMHSPLCIMSINIVKVSIKVTPWPTWHVEKCKNFCYVLFTELKTSRIHSNNKYMYVYIRDLDWNLCRSKIVTFLYIVTYMSLIM